MTTDWAYYNHTNWNPGTEIIPAMNGTSTFIHVNYATTTTTFYVIAEKPLKELLPGENSYILMRTSWEVPPAQQMLRAPHPSINDMPAKTAAGVVLEKMFQPRCAQIQIARNHSDRVVR